MSTVSSIDPLTQHCSMQIHLQLFLTLSKIRPRGLEDEERDRDDDDIYCTLRVEYYAKYNTVHVVDEGHHILAKAYCW